MVTEDRTTAAKGIPIWTGEVKDYKGWYTQFSAFVSTIQDGGDVIKLLMKYKSSGISV